MHTHSASALSLSSFVLLSVIHDLCKIARQIIMISETVYILIVLLLCYYLYQGALTSSYMHIICQKTCYILQCYVMWKSVYKVLPVLRVMWAHNTKSIVSTKYIYKQNQEHNQILIIQIHYISFNIFLITNTSKAHTYMRVHTNTVLCKTIRNKMVING